MTAPIPEVDRLRDRVRKLAEEKSSLQLVIRLIEQLNPLPGLADMLRAMLVSIVETIGGTNIKLYYWDEGDLNYLDFLGGCRTLQDIDDPIVAEVARHRRFIEAEGIREDGLLVGAVVPETWTWAFPLLVGRDLIGVIKIENLHLTGAGLRDHLPIFFSHAALILSNELRNRSRLKAQESLREHQRFLADMIENSGALIFVKDRDGRYQLVNRRWEEVTGLGRDRVLGNTDADLFPRAVAEQFRENDLAVMAAGEVREVEEVLEGPDGNRSFLSIKFPVRGVAGEIVGVCGMITEITRQKNAEADLLKTVEALTNSNTELERFAYVASHDLQEPLRTLVTYSQMLERRHAEILDKDARDFLGFIILAARRMQTLVRDLLAYSRVSSQGRSFVAVDTAKVVGLVRDNLMAAIEESGARLVAGPLPRVQADEMQLVELFQNLIGNAIKFHRDGSAPEIRIAARPEEGHWLFSVADNGIGMEPQYLEQVFVIFKRLHTSTAYPGTGIGLAVCKRIVERHGGRIWAESSAGNGSTFFFTLPAAGSTVPE